MNLNSQYSTIELEEKINELLNEIKDLTSLDDISISSNIYFSIGTPQNQEGGFCYSDENGYHYCYSERGKLTMDKTTRDFFELSYWIIKDQIFNIASVYELKHRVSGKDPRRIMFDKELQLFSSIGKEYEEKAKRDIDIILEQAPYQDYLFL